MPSPVGTARHKWGRIEATILRTDIARLKHRAREEERSVTWIVRKAVLLYLDAPLEAPPAPAIPPEPEQTAAEVAYDTLRTIPKPGYKKDKFTQERVEQAVAQVEGLTAKEIADSALNLHDWERYGRGQRLKTVDGVARLRNWLKREAEQKKATDPYATTDYPELATGEQF